MRIVASIIIAIVLAALTIEYPLFAVKTYLAIIGNSLQFNDEIIKLNAFIDWLTAVGWFVFYLLLF